MIITNKDTERVEAPPPMRMYDPAPPPYMLDVESSRSDESSTLLPSRAGSVHSLKEKRHKIRRFAKITGIMCAWSLISFAVGYYVLNWVRHIQQYISSNALAETSDS